MQVTRFTVVLIIATLLAVACARPGATPIDVEWTLVELEGQPVETGASGQPPTLLLAAKENRASGYAGCNRFTGTYESKDAGLRLGPLAVTRMACPTGMDLEDRYTRALQATREYRVTSQRLELLAEGRVLARFAPR